MFPTFHNLMHRMLTHEDVSARVNLDTFPFFARERDKNGKVVRNKCGRDFLAFAYAHQYSGNSLALDIHRFERAIGRPTPPELVWTGISFSKLIDYLTQAGLEILINGVLCSTQTDFQKALWWPKKISHTTAMSLAYEALKKNQSVGIDISMGLAGLANHVMFVWAIRDNDFVVFDTHKVPRLEYGHFDADIDGFPPNPQRFIMRLPLKTIENRWRRFSRVWVIRRKATPKPAP